MNSTVAVTEPHRWSRQVRRAAERHNRPNPPVSIVRLRGTEHSQAAAGHYEVNWDRRWIVRGHWRNQWFPKAADHKPLFIQPYIKGPEGKPLLPPRESIYSVER